MVVSYDASGHAPTISAVENTDTTITGTGTAGDAVTIKDSSGNVIGTGIVASDGTYSITASRTLVVGEVLTATASDSSGDTSDSANTTVLYDAADHTPTINGVNDTDTTIKRTEIAGDAVTLTDSAGNIIGTGTVGSDGSYTITASRDWWQVKSDSQRFRLCMRY